SKRDWSSDVSSFDLFHLYSNNQVHLSYELTCTSIDNLVICKQFKYLPSSPICGNRPSVAIVIYESFRRHRVQYALLYLVNFFRTPHSSSTHHDWPRFTSPHCS